VQSEERVVVCKGIEPKWLDLYTCIQAIGVGSQIHDRTLLIYFKYCLISGELAHVLQYKIGEPNVFF